MRPERLFFVITALTFGPLGPRPAYANETQTAGDFTVNLSTQPAPIGTLRPTLMLSAQPFARGELLSATFPFGYTIAVWHWTLTAAHAAALTFTTQQNLLPLTSPALTLGSYHVSVEVEAPDGQQSLSDQASFELVDTGFQGALVYPNPWRADRDGASPWITFANMSAGATLKLYTVSGFWVRSLQVTGTSIQWMLDNNQGSRVASGLYFYVIEDGQGRQSRGKLSIIR